MIAHRALAIFFILILALSPLSGSQSYPAPVPVAAAARIEAATGPALAAQAAATATAPAASGTAATAAVGPLPPVVVQTTPAPGEEHPVGAPVIVEFDQPMDPTSTTRAFRIEPAVPGTVAVQGGQLIFKPQGEFKRAAEYQVVVSNTATSVAGLKLPEPVTFKVDTAGYLQVTGVQPADNAQDVAVDAKLIVSFNRPVVPLTGVREQASLPQPLVISPTLKGQGEWLSTSIYQFTPQPGLAAATNYSVTVKGGLTGATGALLDKSYTYHFSTSRPTVLGWRPEGGTNVPVEQPISVTFSMPMDPASAEAAFKLVDAAREPVTGTFTWNADATQMGFKAGRMLAFGMKYLATVGTTARAATGAGSLATPASYVFTTVALPSITRTDPKQGDQAADPGNSLMIQFASPIDRASLVSGTVTILPQPTQVYTYFNESENQLYLNFAKQAATPYTVTVSGKIADPYGNTLGKDYVLKFKTRDYNPSLELSTAGGPVGTYNAYTNTEAVVIYQNVPGVNFSLYEVPLDVFLSLTGPNSYDAWDKYRPAESGLVRKWTMPTKAPRNQMALLSTPLVDQAGKQLDPGLYYLQLEDTTPGKKGAGTQKQLLARTNLNVTLKSSASSALAWVTDLKSGLPVADAKVQLTDGGQVDQTVVTDRDGVAEFTFPRRENEWEQMAALATAPDGRVGIAASNWDQGLSQYNFNLPGGVSARPYNAYVYTDRPIYRPGQTVYWKAVVRQDNDAQYRLPPAGQAVTVTIRDDQGNKLQEERQQFDALGTINGKLALGSEAGLGYYNVDVEVAKNEHYGVGFQVAEYRKPEYQITATTDKPEYIQGDQIKAWVAASYFFGGPVKDARVRWVLMSSDYSFDYQPPKATTATTGTTNGRYTFGDWDWYDYERSRPYGGPLSEGTGTTDARGYFTVTVPADISKFSQSQRFTIDFTITDANNQAVSAQAQAVVHKGEFYIGLRPQSYVDTAGQTSAIDVLTVDTQSRPVSNTEVTLVANRIEWYSVREKQEDGQYFWISKSREVPVYTQTVTTADDGTAVFKWQPDRGGEYKIEATGRDRAGHTIRSAAFVWVGSKEYALWRQENNDRIQLITDKDEYQVGDTAQVLVTSPYQGDIKALLTTERNHVLSHEVIDLQGNSAVLRVPITAEAAPNVFVSLMLVKGMEPDNTPPSFKMGLAKLKVSVAGKQLQVEARPDRATVGPRDTVTWDVTVRDAAGKPVSNTEVSLALVDKAILTLADDQAGKLMDRFYSERALGTRTASSLVMNIDRVVAQLNRGSGKGGGGGGAEGLGELRREFPDVAYWKAVLTTGPDGKAQVKTTLPDNLTTWVMDARAVTADTLVGQSQTEIVATKDLLVRPILPRFFVQGDQAQIGATVHNNTNRSLDVEISMQATGLKVAGASTGNTMTIPAQGSYTAAWAVVVTPGPGQPPLLDQVTVQMRAAGGGLSDAVQTILPVYRYITPEVTGTSGQVPENGKQTELVRMPADADPTSGELDITLEPSLAAGMTGGLTYLTHYPYECVEQTLSRFLPNVVTYQALKTLGLDRPDLQPQLPQQVAIGLQRLYAQQHIDGGWGWWQQDQSNLFISSYVIFGLAKAQQAGFAVDADVLKRGVRYVQQGLAAPQNLKQPYELNQQAFMVYALTVAGSPQPNRAGALYESRDKLSNYAKAYLALALGLINDGASQARVKTLVADLTGKAINSATTTHWEENFVDYWNMNTDTRTTSIVLDALATLDPKHPLAPNTVRWLMLARKADRWETTQENAWSIIALTDWMATTGELQGDYNWQVDLNGDALGRGTVTPQNVGDVTQLVAEVGKLLGNQTNAVVIGRSTGPGQTGKGALYYTMHLKSYLPVDKIEPQSRGVTVSRVYQPAECGQAPANAPALQGEGALAAGPQENTCPTTTQARVGDVLNVKLAIVVPSTVHYLVVEDPLPAGTEAIDTSLKTTSQTAQGPQVQRKPAQGQAAQGQSPYWWWWTPTHTDLRDEKAVLFATTLPPGSYEFNYQVRATLPGKFLTLPPAGYAMYYPEVQGRGAGSVFTVTDK